MDKDAAPAPGPQDPKELFRELLQVYPAACLEDYYTNGKWDVETMEIDKELIKAHRTQSAAPEPPPLDEVELPFIPAFKSLAPPPVRPSGTGTVWMATPPNVPPPGRPSSLPLALAMPRMPALRPLAAPVRTVYRPTAAGAPAVYRPSAAGAPSVAAAKRPGLPATLQAALRPTQPLLRSASAPPQFRPAAAKAGGPIVPRLRPATASSQASSAKPTPRPPGTRPAGAVRPLSAVRPAAAGGALDLLQEMRLVALFVQKFGLEATKTKMRLARLAPARRRWVMATYPGSGPLEMYIAACERSNAWPAAPDNAAPTSAVKRPISAMSGGYAPADPSKRLRPTLISPGWGPKAPSRPPPAGMASGVGPNTSAPRTPPKHPPKQPPPRALVRPVVPGLKPVLGVVRGKLGGASATGATAKGGGGNVPAAYAGGGGYAPRALPKPLPKPLAKYSPRPSAKPVGFAAGQQPGSLIQSLLQQRG